MRYGIAVAPCQSIIYLTFFELVMVSAKKVYASENKPEGGHVSKMDFSRKDS